jgi:Antitoxin-like ribbon-helix-helix
MPKADLSEALASAGGGTRRRVAAPPPQPEVSQPGRAGTKPITAHFPPEVRDQLKILAVEQRTTMHKLIAEAYNDLFAKYGKPEIAPLEGGKT